MCINEPITQGMETTMKKAALLLTVFAILAGIPAHAQTRGSGASQARDASSSFAWGVGLVGLAVIGVVVGVTAAAAASTPSTFSHSS